MHTCARVSRHSESPDTVAGYSGGHGIGEPIKDVQVALEHAAQLSTLAELSASMAHEISQPLSAIVANGAACMSWLSTTPPNIERARQAMERIMRDAQGVSEVAQRIRALYHHDSMSHRLQDLNLLVRETEAFLRAECLRRHATLALALSPMPPIECDRVQIQQVLTNLVRNALDAPAISSDPIRVITVTTDSADAAHVRLVVDDTGPGFSDLRRAFEAFYTTKKSGMGIGLAICRRIVKSHGGSIRARNLRPHGARVELLLPAARVSATNDALDGA